MRRLRRRRGGAATGAAVALCLVSGQVAMACSDLPNICAAQAQHNQQMIDIAATSPRGEEDPAYEPPPFDPMQARMGMATNMIALLQQSVNNAVKRAELQKNPLYATYEKGGWDFFQDHAKPAPGEYCAALFWRKDGFVRVSGPGGDYEGALLTFWGEDIPRPDDVRKVKVSLRQSDGGPPQTVQALNYYLPGDVYGAIALTATSIEVVLDNMLDVHGFDLSMNGKSVAEVEWHGGLAAREKLRACVAARAAR